MNENEINQAEWQNPLNWSGPKWLSVYFSKRDTRVLVPKQMPWMGGTLNLGRTAGVVWLVVILLLLAVAPLAVAIAMRAL